VKLPTTDDVHCFQDASFTLNSGRAVVKIMYPFAPYSPALGKVVIVITDLPDVCAVMMDFDTSAAMIATSGPDGPFLRTQHALSFPGHHRYVACSQPMQRKVHETRIMLLRQRGFAVEESTANYTPVFPWDCEVTGCMEHSRFVYARSKKWVKANGVNVSDVLVDDRKIRCRCSLWLSREIEEAVCRSSARRIVMRPFNVTFVDHE
jgi:hypothetical protein